MNRVILWKRILICGKRYLGFINRFSSQNNYLWITQTSKIQLWPIILFNSGTLWSIHRHLFLRRKPESSSSNRCKNFTEIRLIHQKHSLAFVRVNTFLETIPVIKTSIMCKSASVRKALWTKGVTCISIAKKKNRKYYIMIGQKWTLINSMKGKCNKEILSIEQIKDLAS